MAEPKLMDADDGSASLCIWAEHIHSRARMFDRLCLGWWPNKDANQALAAAREDAKAEGLDLRTWRLVVEDLGT
jgi:hypothetical protein